MNLTTAQNSVEKLLSYIKSISESDSSLYTKSKEKLSSISKVCVECVNVISDILQEESLNDDYDEFDSTSLFDSDIQMQIQSLSDQVEKLQTYFHCKKEPEYNKTENEYPLMKYTYDCDLSSADLSKIVQDYRFVLNRVCMKDSKYTDVNRCSSILWKWFDARIIKQHPSAPKFHYDVHRFKSIIYSFVISIGYHIENNTLDDFESSLDSWIDSLDTSPVSNKWIAPYEIYEIERGRCSKYLSLTSVILWDILLGCGMKELCKCGTNIYLKETGVWDIVNRINPDILDNYFIYSDDPEKISIVGIK